MGPGVRRDDVGILRAIVRADGITCLTGKSANCCPAPFAKIFPFPPDPNQIYIDHVPPPQRGVSRSSRTRGGMRWTRQRRACDVSQGELNLVSD